MTLRLLQIEVELRCGSTLAAQPDWPCRAGCDRCCRSLSRVPEATAEEWELVDRGLARLSERVRCGIDRRLSELAAQSAPVTCPFLDDVAGNCLVYEERPIACRTYGFYVEREAGLYCREIEARVRRGELDSVVWGNQCAVDARLDELGPRIPLTEWRRAAPPSLPR